MALNINTVVNVSLSEAGASLLPNSPNNIAVFTSNTGLDLSETNRFVSFRSLTSVGDYFGTFSDEYAVATSVFGTSPNNINAGGSLTFCYVNSVDGGGATPAVLTSGSLDVADISGVLNAVTDGYFSITVDGLAYDLENINLSSVSTAQDVAANIQSAADSAFVPVFVVASDFGPSYQIDIISNSTGSSATLSYVSDEGLLGTYIGDLLSLESATALNLSQGSDGTSTQESPQDALQAAVDAGAQFLGCMFMAQPTGDDLVTFLPSVLEANNKILYQAFSFDNNPNILSTDTLVSDAYAARLVDAGATKVRMIFSKKDTLGALLHCATYMSKQHSVDVDRSNSALTMHLKQLNTTTDDVSEIEYNSCQQLGLSVYTKVSTASVNLESGVNGWTDEEFFKAAFVDSVKVSYFNALSSTRTKVSQTESGVAVLENAVRQDCVKFSNSEFIGAGTWNSSDFFGDEEVFNRKIEEQGFYVKAESLSAQSQAQRETRVAPAINVAVKYTGAFHSGNVFITFEA